MYVNGDKTKYMLFSRIDANHNALGTNVNTGNHNIEVVPNFIYLGSEVTSDNNTSVEVKRRIVLLIDVYTVSIDFYDLSNYPEKQRSDFTTSLYFQCFCIGYMTTHV